MEGFITLVDSLFKLEDLKKVAGFKEIKKQEEIENEREESGVMSELEIAKSQMKNLEKTNRKLEKQKGRLEKELARTKEELQSTSRELRHVLDTKEKERKTRMVPVSYCEQCLKAKSIFMEEQVAMMGYLRAKRSQIHPQMWKAPNFIHETLINSIFSKVSE